MMQVKHLVIEKMDECYSVVKNTQNNKYVKLGLREIRYLFELLEVPGEEQGECLLNQPEKEFLKGKFEEWGFWKSNTEEEIIEKKAEKKDWTKIKIVQINPEKFLEKIPRFLTGLYTKAGFTAVLLLALAKYIVLAPYFREMCSDAINIELSAGNVVLFYVLTAGSGILHEFGHALACRRYGGKISAMGIMLYFLSPVMYCDVSDVYLMKNKKAGVFVALGGIFTELLIGNIMIWMYMAVRYFFPVNAGVLLLVWAFTVLSVIINLFPFVKYDGYWVLTSVLNVSNLMDKATTLFIARICGGKDVPEGIPRAKKCFLSFYGAIALICRVLFWGLAVYNMAQISDRLNINGKVSLFVIVVVTVSVLRVEFRFCKEQIKKYKIDKKRILGLLTIG